MWTAAPLVRAGHEDPNRHDRDDPNRNKKKVGGIGREQLNAAVRAVQVKDEPKPAKPVAKPAKWVDEL